MKKWLLLLSLGCCSATLAAPGRKTPAPCCKDAGAPVIQKKTHTIGNLHLTVTNYGYFGAGDDFTYVSCQFPAWSNTEYLYWGGLWIGAIVEKGDTLVRVDTLVDNGSIVGIDTLYIHNDTFVSVGVEGWAQWQYEMYASPDPADTIYQLSTTGGNLGDSSIVFWGDTIEASAEQEFLCRYTDTLENAVYVGPDHHPLGLEITQRSYAWSYDYAEDFVIIDFWIKNVSDRPLSNVYMGLYIDDACGPTGDWATIWCVAQDDLTGFRKCTDPSCEDTSGNPKTKISVAWSADASGRQLCCTGSAKDWPAPCVTGTRVLRTPNDNLTVSYNWWVSDSDPRRDWGPFDPSNPNDSLFRELYQQQHGDTSPGTPDTDREKYLLMSNGLFDPDLLEAPPDGRIRDPWDDERYLLSFGPVFPEGADQPLIQPGESVPITIAYIGGESFHHELGEEPRGETPSEMWYDFSDLAFNAFQALDVYDNPGVDTDGDGYRGDSIVDPETGEVVDWTGDGVPDFGGYRPPVPPNQLVVAGDRRVTIYWDDLPEPITADNFPPFFPDFEGYRLYKTFSTATQEIGGHTLLGQWDIIEHIVRDPAYLDSVRMATGIDLDSMHQATGYNLWPPPLNSDTIEYPEFKYCWVDSPVLNYYRRHYLVASFDFGNPKRFIPAPPLESGSYADTVVSPAPPPSEFAGLKEKILVVPNPYRIDSDDLFNPYYSRQYWEDPERSGWNEHKRRLDFIHLPERCTIRIYTLTGDLVKTIEHPGEESTSQTSASWRLISRDVQAVVSGVYLFSVEEQPSGTTQVGKFVIIK